MALPLEDISLIEAASATAPPGLVAAIGLCGRVAADLGARVTCVLPEGATASSFLAAGKRLLRGPAGLVADLAASADVLVSDAATPGQPRRVRAVMSMDGAGDAGQSAFTIEARAGLLDIVGDPARSPLRLAGHQSAYAAGLACFTAMVAALCQDAPQLVCTSLLETAVWLNWKGVAVAARTGEAPKRAGSNGEWPVVACADGHVVVVHRAQEWERMKALIPALRQELFETAAGRRQHRADFNAILARHFATLTRADIHDLALRQKLPFGAVWSPEELPGDPQMVARGMFATDGMPRLPARWARS